ncbi:uncharacterized protein LOC107883449 [Acyrthosiphon pisum]|uniref:Uncharacterized protein n=1 Tax=Acyrthosiphon pisum TaxID=7029 RepID=A0A8R2H8J9_ACYPI|nr:uncharacterized protein LOC107883449 [Acyrthosiphon pisum]|eukprot:XP_016658976.1 PREDICTED: uncharacterized protein LOC107883449 [Acyrthosiphon pisum]
MSDHQQPTPADPIQLVAELLEMRRRNQQTTRADPGIKAARIRNMPLNQLQRDPELWTAYIRGWEDKTADKHRSLLLTQSSAYQQPSPPTTPHNTTITTTNTTLTGPQPAPTASGLTAQERKIARIRLAQIAREEAKAKASEQRGSPITPQPLTTFRDDRAVDGHSPAGSATTGHATTSAHRPDTVYLGGRSYNNIKIYSRRLLES